GRVFGKLRNEVVAAMGSAHRIIVVAGVAPGSASSVVCANLAASLARAGDPTVAVAAHPGGPVTVTGLLGVQAVPGLSDVFAERVDLAEATHRAARQPQLEVVGPGACGNAAGPTGDVIAEIYTKLRDRASYVVVDAAPMSISAEAQLLAAGADAVILAVECGRDRVHDVSEAVQAVRRIDAPLLGAVVLPKSRVTAAEPVAVPDAAPDAESDAVEPAETAVRRPTPYPRGKSGKTTSDAERSASSHKFDAEPSGSSHKFDAEPPGSSHKFDAESSRSSHKFDAESSGSSHKFDERPTETLPTVNVDADAQAATSTSDWA
ncbi:MAG: tyrosine-protein kinase family protein, partial [Stackebrandtia sp.]